MSGYRLHIDIPLGDDEEDAIRRGKFIAQDWLRFAFEKIGGIDSVDINYRLGHDDDRQKSNYFHKNENGHVNNKKSSYTLGGYKMVGFIITNEE